MENVKLARQDWETAHIDSIAKQEKKTSKAKLLFDLYQVQDKKPVQARALKKSWMMNINFTAWNLI